MSRTQVLKPLNFKECMDEIRTKVAEMKAKAAKSKATESKKKAS